MATVPPLIPDDAAALQSDLRDVVAPWAGVLRATLLGACAWAVLLGAWLLG